MVPREAVTFCRSFEVKFQEPEAVESKALKEFVKVEDPLKVLAKEELKTKVEVATALGVELGSA